MDVLSEAVEDAGKGEPQIRAHLGAITPNQVKRYFGRTSFPTAAGVERYVAAVSLETGRDRFDLWAEAIKRAKKAGALSVEELAAGALRDADAADRATRKVSGRSPSSRSPKAKKRQAG
jgi:hypothetical protein